MQWMAQKDTLGQDMFLVGSPGSLPRRLAFAYCQLTGREIEYVSLSRDTTETDLKQRREIVAGTVHYVNQPAVESALEGRVLVLEGVEKAERNVLPVLNNLLENREMQLDDGHLIVAPQRYDRLVEDHGEEMARKWHLLRASERFRVIAIGAPVPPYRGNPLDPPLRSRFQARSIQPLSYQELSDLLRMQFPNVSPNKLSSLVQLVLTLQTVSASLPGGPVELTQQLHHVLEILSDMPGMSAVELLLKIYPADLLGTMNTIKDTLENFELKDTANSMHIHSFGPWTSHGKIDVELRGTSASIFTDGVSSLLVPCGPHTGDTANSQEQSLVAESDYIPTQVHEDILARMIQSHKTGDFCLVGEKGTGKETLVKRFASLLGYEIETVVLYQDMTSRELLQHRSTLPNGDTVWRSSPLVNAARQGKLALLDGVHRLHPGTLSVVKRLLQDRELSLMDGSRLLSHTNYQTTKDFAGLSDEDMAQRSIYAIHPAFRVVGIGEPPVKSAEGSSQPSWISPEVLTMFQFHQIPHLPIDQERHILEDKVPNLPGSTMDSLLSFTNTLRTSSDPTLQSLSSLLSTRQLIRIAGRLAEYPSDNVHHVIHKSCLSRFLPQLTREALSKSLRDGGVLPPPSSSLPLPPIEYSYSGEYLLLGSTKTKVKSEHTTAAIVPDILFYDNQEHLRILEDMVKDYTLGEHLLLVGNQGVGKNKIADRFLQLLRLPREYIQLHRDTTVQSLTLQPTVEGGVVRYQDSPLVRAVQLGRVLVVDEADKAPTNVTCVLKNIIGKGDVTLADGRRIVHSSHHHKSSDSTVIPVHPDFRMIALANRPGFPFLGNDFYAALGDMFSCHAIDNPDFESELTMLRQYGRDVPEHLLQKLVGAFSELRAMADEGLIAYPYSTREVVAVVKHLQEYPHEGVSSVVRNVFDFDTHNTDLLQVVSRVLHRHGIPAGASPTSVQLSPVYPLRALKQVGQWTVNTGNAVTLDVQHLPVALKGPFRGKPTELDLEKVNVRGREFSELLSHWRLPLDRSGSVASTSIGPGSSFDSSKILHAALTNPVSVVSMPLSATETRGYWLDLSSLFPIAMGMWTPQLHLAPLPHGRMLLHEGLSNSMFTVDAFDGCVYRVTTDSIAKSVKDMLGWGHSSSQQGESVLLSGKDCTVHVFRRGGAALEWYKLTGQVPSGTVVNLPFSVGSMHAVSENQWLLTEFDSPRWYILRSSGNNKRSLYEGVTIGDLMPSQLTAVGERNGTADLAAGRHVFVAGTTVGLLDTLPHNDRLEMTVHAVPLEEAMESDVVQNGSVPVIFPESGDIALPTVRESQPGVALVDLTQQTLREIVLPQSDAGSAASSSYPQLHLNVVSDSQLATVDQQGTVRLLETQHASLERSLSEWQALVGQDPGGPLHMEYERESGRDVSSPKHGKVDPDNTPHVGGNTWAGGTGGRDTAGLGGKGGPYRLDAGHDIHQIPDWEKEAVPEEVKRAAREMGQKAKREKLREIGMSEHDNEMYQTMLGKVQRQVQTLRVMLANIQSRSTEREWIRHQTTGDLDERKLIEGLAGEKAIYKRRGEKEPEVGAGHVYPKCIRLVVDVSGSMYRFNSHDGRLERSLEAVLVVMEAFDKQTNFKLDIVGHSGDSIEVPFVQSANPPANDKERLQVLKAMIAESQYCWSGDNTVEATRTAIQQITKEPADEYFVIVFSDANFSRYAIRPSHFASLMNSDPRVNVFAIFIGSLGDQAKRLREALPSGRSLICMNNKDLPQQLQQILLSTIK